MKDILIVDDEKDIRTLLSTILEDEGYHTRTAADSTELFDILKGRLPNIILLDIWLKKSQLDGLEILHKLAQNFPDIDVIMISGHGNIETAVRAMQIGAYSFLEKPVKSSHLLLMLERIIEKRKLKIGHRKAAYVGYTQNQMPAFLQGNSTEIANVKLSLSKHADKDCRILITGEAGTGKYALAEYIHYHSMRSDASFVAVRSSLKMSQSTLERELFGFCNPNNPEYVGHKGALENAHGGTIYLENIDLYPHTIQRKIIKYLVDKKFNRFMSPDTMVVSDARVIASLSMMPDLSIKNNLLLNDLYVRLCVVTMAMPNLKKRSEDMLVLIAAYIKEIATEYKGYAPEFAPETIEFLQGHDWQNNLRSMRDFIKNLIQDAYGRHDYKPITRKHLHEYLPTGQGLLHDATLQQSLHKPLRDARESFEKNYLLYHLNRFKGNISRTAQFVGMERSALHRKLRSLDIENLRDEHYDLVD